jgi:toxin ParE1/3/4
LAEYRFTVRARADLLSIAVYTRSTWGDDQARKYLLELQACCQRLAEEPALGRVHQPRPQYSRIEQGKHVLFFRRTEEGDVVIVRILHGRMLPDLHLSGEPQE